MHSEQHTLRRFRSVHWGLWLALSCVGLRGAAVAAADEPSHAAVNGGTQEAVQVTADAAGTLHFGARDIDLPNNISPQAREFLRKAYQEPPVGISKPFAAP